MRHFRQSVGGLGPLVICGRNSLTISGGSHMDSGAAIVMSVALV